MRINFIVLLFSFLSFNLSGQDAYHTFLQNTLQNDYGLPAGVWVLNDTELGNLNSDYSYGNISTQDLPAVDQFFSEKVNIVVNSGGTNPWDAGYGISNVQQIGSGDVCLLVIWLRAVGNPGSVNLFVENASTFNKEVFLTLDLSTEWTPYSVPFQADQTYAPGTLNTGLHLALQAQTIELGGLAILNYSNSVSIDDLPNQTNNDQYGGWEPDAPWRAEAASRIENIRKANLTVRVENADGTPIPDAEVQIEMLQHDYAFGSAVVSRLFAGNNGHNATYESKLLDLDGEGHGFNWVVFENALKWPGWEQNWISSKAETAHAVEWLREHDIKIRGHNLLWPGWSNMPPDIQNNQNDINYIKNRIEEHIETIVAYPGIEGNIAEWDVLNEITTNRDLEFAFQGQAGYPTGREIYPEVFNKLKEVDPNTKTYLNDYVTISQANSGGGLYDLKKQFAQEIIDAGVQLDGIGFQGHIGAFPTSIYEVEQILDDFYNTFGTKAKITEYDTNEGMGDDLAATYLRDFLTMVFSHPSTDGFLTWGFWNGAHWHDNAPFFYQNWTLKPAGQAFIDLVFDEWWTEESGSTDANGEYQIRGFKGKYKVTIDCGNEMLTDTIELLNDMVLVKSEGMLSTGLHPDAEAGSFSVYPNPASDFLHIEKETDEKAEVFIFDSTGKAVFSQKMTGSSLSIPLNFGKGVYEVVLVSENRNFVVKVVGL